ncbi:MAG: hypothetical protein U0T83_09495 [Bacteriovoracaceae bacterium]
MKLFIVLSLLSLNLFAFDELDLNPNADKSVSKYRKIINNFMDLNLYYPAIPLIKEYFVLNKGNAVHEDVERAIEKVITNIGVKQFEFLPEEILKASRSEVVKYVLAKKYFKRGEYDRAIQETTLIPSSHYISPFALNIAASAYSILGRSKEAITTFGTCVERSRNSYSKMKDENQRTQLEINQDYCQIGIARTHFAEKNFEEAEMKYLDIPKSSYIWPETLFEEAWNSFYLKNFNRTLGKLVTYKAPVFDYVFNPEIDILNTLTYMELCLWSDVKRSVDNFYEQYEKPSEYVAKFIADAKENYQLYFKLAIDRRTKEVEGNELFNKILKSIIRDPTFNEMVDAYFLGEKEYATISGWKTSRLKEFATENLRESLKLQRDLIGSYVKRNMSLKFSQLDNAFSQMSYIKLEVLSRRKNEIYSFQADPTIKRGDVQYLKRNEKQYFWTFNGEFWADEIGDYVFALKSECVK